MDFRPTSPTRPLTPHHPLSQKFFPAHWLQRLSNVFTKEDLRCQSPDRIDGTHSQPEYSSASYSPCRNPSVRPVSVGLPRQCTFQRFNDERKENMYAVLDSSRANSPIRRRHSRSPRGSHCSLPLVKDTLADATPATCNDQLQATSSQQRESSPLLPHPNTPLRSSDEHVQDNRPPRPVSRTSSIQSLDDIELDQHSKDVLSLELDSRWILNLSMHFKDHTNREKFFITFAETPVRWRRVTVSVDYRNAEPGSLETDIKQLHHQREKNLQIYEAIRDSLAEIQFYDTVTNLKLETTDGRLHVHVTEDVNEIISHPEVGQMQHILDHADSRGVIQIPESEITFDAHLSGFVYRVHHGGKVYVKKEIPSPDTVDEFLYEINALHALRHSDHVIKLEALVVDDSHQLLKGLLISYAPRGSVVDILYNDKGNTPWADRERWARQAVTGLRDIHEEGYVQGDFTISNLVVDNDDNAKIIDINRRGCPVGWEPPEIAEKLASKQRISMYIGEKSDLYQLGITLWALAMNDDEPEEYGRPLSTAEFPGEVPVYLANIIRICLSKRPKDRLSAKELVYIFPVQPICKTSNIEIDSQEALSTHVEYDRGDASTRISPDRSSLEQYHRERTSPTFVTPKIEDHLRDDPDTMVQFDSIITGISASIEEYRGRSLRRPGTFLPSASHSYTRERPTETVNSKAVTFNELLSTRLPSMVSHEATEDAYESGYGTRAEEWGKFFDMSRCNSSCARPQYKEQPQIRSSSDHTPRASGVSPSQNIDHEPTSRSNSLDAVRQRHRFEDQAYYIDHDTYACAHRSNSSMKSTNFSGTTYAQSSGSDHHTSSKLDIYESMILADGPILPKETTNSPLATNDHNAPTNI